MVGRGDCSSAGRRARARVDYIGLLRYVDNTAHASPSRKKGTCGNDTVSRQVLRLPRDGTEVDFQTTD